MKTQKICIKNVFAVLILMTLPVTSVYAAKDLNRLLKGVYANNSTWTCIGSPAPFTNDPNNSITIQVTTAGEITYNGDGTASGEGRVGTTTNDGFADIADYTCEWSYQVNEDRTFSREGVCEAESIFNLGPPEFVTDQIWYGHMGKGRKTLLVERHDGEIEGSSFDGITNHFERVCGKAGVEIKLKRKK